VKIKPAPKLDARRKSVRKILETYRRSLTLAFILFISRSAKKVDLFWPGAVHLSVMKNLIILSSEVDKFSYASEDAKSPGA